MQDTHIRTDNDSILLEIVRIDCYDERMVLILMGVSGAGKTTVGKMLARDLGWAFLDADDYHPENNKRKMRMGIALTDEDRMPWLENLAGLIRSHLQNGTSMVLACSALREAYRKQLGVDQDEVLTVYLKGEEAELAKRLAERSHEFFNPGLLKSQLATLEEPEGGLILEMKQSPVELVQEIRKWIAI